PDELLNSAVHDAASGKPRIAPFAYMIIRDATGKHKQLFDTIKPDESTKVQILLYQQYEFLEFIE
ncbi:hypothetical protein KTN04_05805, partial [Marinobacterium sp. A346]|nr:hypothetical protein [Marinobacterium weihaiense]